MAEEHNQALFSISVEAVWVRRRAYLQNGYRPFPVYNPEAVDRAGQPIPNAGKRARGKNWREAAAEDPPRAVRLRPDTDALNTGFLTGRLVAIDIDVPDQALIDNVTRRSDRGDPRADAAGAAGAAAKARTALSHRDAVFKKDHDKAPVPRCGREQADRRRMPGERTGLVADGVHPERGGRTAGSPSIRCMCGWRICRRSPRTRSSWL